MTRREQREKINGLMDEILTNTRKAEAAWHLGALDIAQKAAERVIELVPQLNAALLRALPDEEKS